MDKMVLFAGEKFSISDQLPLYVSILDEFEEYKGNLLKILANQINNNTFVGCNKDDWKVWEKPINDIASSIIANLSNYDQYDITVSELVSNNPGYKHLREAEKTVLVEHLENIEKVLSSEIEEMNKQERIAMSKITGSGVGILTNSFSSAMLYHVLESSVIKKQANKASAEYEESLKKFIKRAQNDYENSNVRSLEKYYRTSNECISELIAYMLIVYLRKLNQVNTISIEELEKYDMAVSTEILGNINITASRIDVVKKAFEKCPYNPDIYIKLIEINKIDMDSFATAKYLKQDGVILTYIKRKIDSDNKVQNVNELMKIWADYEGVSYAEIFRKVYSPDAKSVQKRLNDVREAAESNDKCLKWLNQYFGDFKVNLLRSASNISASITDIVYKIIDEETFNKYVYYQLIDAKRIGLVSNTSMEYQEILDNLIDKLSLRIVSIIEFNEQRFIIYNAEIEKILLEQDKVNGQISRIDDSCVENEKKLSNDITYIRLTVEKRRLDNSLESIKSIPRKLENPDTVDPIQQIREIRSKENSGIDNEVKSIIDFQTRQLQKKGDGKKALILGLVSISILIVVVIIFVVKSHQLTVNSDEVQSTSEKHNRINEMNNAINTGGKNTAYDNYLYQQGEDIYNALSTLKKTIRVSETYATIIDTSGKIIIDGYGSNGFIPDTSSWGIIDQVFPIGNGLIARDINGKLHMAQFPDQNIKLNSESMYVDITDIVGIILGLTEEGKIELVYDEFNNSDKLLSQSPDVNIVKISGDGTVNSEYFAYLTDTGEIGLIYNKDSKAEKQNGRYLRMKNDVSRWKDIVDISASFNHILGLKSDGTVVAAGASDKGQGLVENWNDVVKIAAGDGFSVGLNTEGKVLYSGSNAFNIKDVEKWENIIYIDAKEYSVIGLDRDGNYYFAGDINLCNIPLFGQLGKNNPVYKNAVGVVKKVMTTKE